MKFCEPEGLTCISYANGFSLWHYRTTHSKGDVTNYSYFSNIKSFFNPGDMIIVNSLFTGDNFTLFVESITNDWVLTKEP